MISNEELESVKDRMNTLIGTRKRGDETRKMVEDISRSDVAYGVLTMLLSRCEDEIAAVFATMKRLTKH